MKIALACESILLEKSLTIFLKNFIVPYKQCDFVISDKDIKVDKPLFFIATENSNLNIPFTKSALMLKIEKFYNSLGEKKEDQVVKKVSIDELEKKITKLTDSFREDLLSVIKEYYEK